MQPRNAVALLWLSPWLLADCTEDRCTSDRDLLTDTARFTLCPDDEVLFSPGQLVFGETQRVIDANGAGGEAPMGSGAPGASGADSGQGGSLPIPGESGQGGEAATAPAPMAGEAGQGEEVPASSSEAPGALVAVIARSQELVPRSLATIDVFECDEGRDEQEPLLDLSPASGGACKSIGARLRCTTNREGVAEFHVLPLPNREGTTGICAGSEALEDLERRLFVTINPRLPDGLRVFFKDAETRVGAAHYALACSSSPPCSPSTALRASEVDLRLRSGEGCNTASSCDVMLVNRSLAVTVNVELESGQPETFGLSSDGTCTSLSKSMQGRFGALQPKLDGVHLCTDGAAARYRVSAVLDGAEGRAVAQAIVTTDPDPIVIKVSNVRRVSVPPEGGAGGAPSGDAGIGSGSATLELGYESCPAAGAVSVVDDAFWERMPDGSSAELRLQLDDSPSIQSLIISKTAHPDGTTVIDAADASALLVSLLSGDGSAPAACFFPILEEAP